MCSRVNCRKCGKVTYSGCGQHLDQVFAGVPQNQRCDCASKASSTNADKQSVLSKIFGR
jgi:hypothetical protein